MATRRTFMRGLAVTATGTALAGCSSGGGSSDGGDGDSSGGDGGGADSGSGDGGGSEWVETSTVEMTDELGFEPQKIQVEAGTTITFENVGSIGHTVTAYEDEIPDDAEYWASGGFDSESAAKDGYGSGQEGNIPQDESWGVTLEATGEHEYYCIPHEMNGMVGTIKVV